MAESHAAVTKSPWVEYVHQDGRKYYYHQGTKQTVWQKPDELKTPKELALETSPWKEYTTPENKKYYHNAATQETVWTVPEDYKVLLDQLAEETKARESAASATLNIPSSAQAPPKSVTPTSSSAVSTPSPLRQQTLPHGSQSSPATAAAGAIAGGPRGTQQQPPMMAMRDAGSDPAWSNSNMGFMPQNQAARGAFASSHHAGGRPPRFQQSFVPQDGSGNRGRDRAAEALPEFETKEEAELAFKNLLKETGVTSTWTWEQTMRAVIANPIYRAAFSTVAERKTAFQEYVEERRIQEKQEEKARQQKQKQDFLDLMKQHSDKVTHASRYSTVSRLLADEPAFKAITDDRYRHSIFDSYVGELVRQEKEDARQKRKAGTTALITLLQSLDEITLVTRWAEAKELLREAKAFKESDAIQALSKAEQLSIYEDHIKHLEKEYDQKRAKERLLRKRAERKRREAFKGLLGELRTKGHVNASTYWMQIFSLIKDDSRYLEMLGQPGSTPMELFWDMIEDLEDRLYQDRKMVQEQMKNINYDIQPETKLEEFVEAMAKQERVRSIQSEDLKLIFDHLLDRAVHHAKEEKRRQEKLARKRAESFRFMLKSLTPVVTVESSWEDVKAKTESTPEFAALETDEKRREVFDRYIERLKERSTKSYDSDDEDGSILEDDADYYSKRASQDRKRAAASSSNHHRSSHHHSSGDHARRSTTAARDHSPSSKNAQHHHEKRPRGDTVDTESGPEDDQEHRTKKSKPAAEESAPLVAVERKVSAAEEDGEVVETPAPQ
ncbi:hypothetical protein BGZ98_005400 [Dissophora globulifera]|nr:hypothetical protein BGZ98_005400 [Dissophora globulifera]